MIGTSKVLVAVQYVDPDIFLKPFNRAELFRLPELRINGELKLSFTKTKKRRGQPLWLRLE